MTTDNNEVVSLFGGAAVTATPRPAVIKMLEALLEAARSGEVGDDAAAFLHGDGAASTRLVGLSNRTSRGALAELQYEVLQQAVGDGG